jgi:transglutaminase-like putative cysteine protease
MYPESEDLNEYLASDTVVDWQHTAVQKKAMELTYSLSDEVAKARCLYEWVRDAISHSDDAEVDVVTCTASEVLQQGAGNCFAKSHLLAAMLRGVMIPAGFCYQVLRSDPPDDNEPVLHGFNAIYLATLGKWIRVDARGNTRGINAQFSTKKERLAFEMDENAEEFIYEAIFAAPVSSVVAVLKKYSHNSDLWLNLPQSL